MGPISWFLRTGDDSDPVGREVYPHFHSIPPKFCVEDNKLILWESTSSAQTNVTGIGRVMVQQALRSFIIHIICVVG
jgi:hypothetical protein